MPTLPAEPQFCLPFGNGRSYGDVCLNNGGTLLLARGLDRFIAFDPATGILRAEAGVLLSEILALIVPQGWFLSVTPGTQMITLGGAIANDVHGKNHHWTGSFGCHVRAFELRRSTGEQLLCTPIQNADWFRATVGGLGLTGLITWVEIQLQRIANPWIVAENRRFASLDEFLALNAEYEARYPYTVSWIDCAATGRALGRGIYMAGMHAPPGLMKPPPPERRALTVPFAPPVSLVNNLSVRGFNRLYYHLPRPARGLIPYQPFFYPLDNLLEWNRLYGRRGFFQYQCVIPPAAAREALLPAGQSVGMEPAVRAAGFFSISVRYSARRRSRSPAGHSGPHRRQRSGFDAGGAQAVRRPDFGRPAVVPSTRLYPGAGFSQPGPENAGPAGPPR